MVVLSISAPAGAIEIQKSTTPIHMVNLHGLYKCMALKGNQTVLTTGRSKMPWTEVP
jgi:hypothetical protein